MADFDKYADSYEDAVERSIAFSGASHDYFTRRKAELLAQLARRFLGDPAGISVLDVGCGVGATDRMLTGRFGEVYGVDPSAEAVGRAARDVPGLTCVTAGGGALPFRDGSFDLVFAICVVHHVPPESRTAFAADLRRVTKKGGMVALFEHNPFNPLTRRAVRGCELDDDAQLLTRRATRRLLSDAGLEFAEAAYVIFTTSDRPRVKAVERSLRAVPLGAQYYVAGRA